MEVKINRIDGLDDAIVSMYFSKRNIDADKERDLRGMVFRATVNPFFNPTDAPDGALDPDIISDELKAILTTLFKWGKVHTTLLRFIDFSCTVYGMHRGGQDDFDSHAMRLNSRIIRSSTRLAKFSEGEVSDYYKEKIIPTDLALSILQIPIPDKIQVGGSTFIKRPNGYIIEGMEDNKDARRGLYMMSIPSNFIFRCNLTEFAHIYQQRNKSGSAHDEVKLAVEAMADQLEAASCGFINRELLLGIKN